MAVPSACPGRASIVLSWANAPMAQSAAVRNMGLNFMADTPELLGMIAETIGYVNANCRQNIVQ
jgi:hypothetical protein